MTTNVLVGTDGANSLTGTSGADVIYGYDPNAIAAERVATGLDQPLFAGAPSGDPNRLFVAEKEGAIKVLDLSAGHVLETPFIDLSAEISAAGEGGLLGLAFDPDYANNGFFYVDLINLNGDTEVRRYHVSDNPNVADAESATLILTIDQPAGRTNHKGGWIGFGPDGDLYIATGDGGGGGDPDGNGQNLNTLLGKMLRIDVHGDDFPADTARNYAIPADNPFVGTPGADEIWAFGLRNPFRNSFDRELGTLFIADVGQNKWEEINIGKSGANYGWNIFEGPERYAPGTPATGTEVSPIFSYDHSVGTTVIGGYVYRGEGESLQGQYFFADFGTGHIYTLRESGSGWIATDQTSHIHANLGSIDMPASFAEDGIGDLYVVDLDGDVFKLTPNGPSNDIGDTLNGGAGNDLLFGGSGGDTLNGGAGADHMFGGTGSDTYVVDSVGDVVDETGGDGLDLVKSSISFSLADVTRVFGHIENLTLGGRAAINATGNDLDNVLIGNSAKNTLNGGGGSDWLNGASGADKMYGGTGNDTYVIDNKADVASEQNGDGSDTILSSRSFSLADPVHAVGSIENLTLTGSATKATGNFLDNVLTGNDRANLLVGGVGADRLDGGGGVDTASYTTSAAGVTVNLATGIGSGADAQGDRLFNIENLTGSNFNDTLEGNAGNNKLAGGAGIDTISYADATSGANGEGVTVRLSTTRAQKTVTAGTDSLSGFENLIGSQFNDTLTGNSGNNVLTGLAGNDRLTGAGGNDTYIFLPGFGKDTITDFAAGPNSGRHDLIVFDDTIFADFDALAAASAQVGANTVITVDADNSITLANVNIGSLHHDDFAFGWLV